MTVVTVNAPVGRLSVEQRRELAVTLTDAVLVPEVGAQVDAARAGFQVHFVERASDSIAIDGTLVSDRPSDPMQIDIAVMDGDWSQSVRTAVIERVFAALSAAMRVEAPAPTWWVNFRVIDEGSWGSRGGVLSIHSLLDQGVFTAEKAAAIRRATAPAELS
ncbi:hypothetical protein QT969_13785 [Rhodococcus sp. CSLK01-03]|uniref:Tautomerase enzyme n=1 Tax=Rhodococcus indonesiensis TaxID=3055869 RepID=A0ABT7RNX8_9NOCA|nr:hypothetical protein [Rhodococcus indonesiensis]MDM7489351.1 hypothetical protein [Rhodococcus indonesiensis]